MVLVPDRGTRGGISLAAEEGAAPAPGTGGLGALAAANPVARALPLLAALAAGAPATLLLPLLEDAHLTLEVAP
jgi:hypothetical protein